MNRQEQGTGSVRGIIETRAPELIEAVDRAARQNLLTRSAYARMAILDRLRADGFAPADLAAT